MIKEDCLYYEKCKDMGATIDWCRNYPHLNFDCEKCERYIEKNFVSVVRCKDCIYYGDHGDGEMVCAMMILYPNKPTDYCSLGERKKDAEKTD